MYYVSLFVYFILTVFQTKLKKPHAQFFSRKQKKELRPFEAVNEIEKFCHKYDSSLFTFASSNKKRPNNLVMGKLDFRCLI